MRRPLDRAETVHPGFESARSIVTYGAMVSRCLEAAGELAGEGISARVVDLRSLSPLDVQLLGTCARETGRVIA